MLETASLKSQQINLDPSAWLDTIRDKREHMFLCDPTRSDQSQHICPSFFPTPRSICNLLLHHIFFSLSPLLSVFSLSSCRLSSQQHVVQSGSLSGGCTQCACAWDGRQAWPIYQALFLPLLLHSIPHSPAVDSAVHLYASLSPRMFGMYVCSIRLSVSFSLSPRFSL